MKKSAVIYLETNGINYGAIANLRQMVDVVSMDFKLPSATGLRPFWKEHEQFLSAARGAILFVKAVVTGKTNSGRCFDGGKARFRTGTGYSLCPPARLRCICSASGYS